MPFTIVDETDAQILIAMHEQETDSNAPNEQLGHTAPDIDCAEKELGAQKREVRQDKGMVTKRPPPKHTIDNDQLGEHARHAVRSGKSRSGC